MKGGTIIRKNMKRMPTKMSTDKSTAMLRQMPSFCNLRASRFKAVANTTAANTNLPEYVKRK